MPHNEVKKTIDELKGELTQTPQETGLFEETLESAKEGIEHYTPEAVKDLVQILQREADEFEVEHPRITALINNVMSSLSNLGI
jgi:prefoldin subunit 5